MRKTNVLRHSFVVERCISPQAYREGTMNTSLFWKAGDKIVLREVLRGKVWSAKPVTVVQDTPDLVALWMASGTCWKVPRALDGSPVRPSTRLPDAKWQLVDQVWEYGDTLFLAVPGNVHAVHVMWSEGRSRFAGWYINLQDPIERTPIGFDYMDQLLDIVVSPDQSEWHWKDRDEFLEAQTIGVISPQKAHEIWAEGERVISLMLAGKPPFNSGWENWFPPSDWNIPQLSENWYRV